MRKSLRMVPLALTTVQNCVEVRRIEWPSDLPTVQNCAVEWALRLAHCVQDSAERV